MSTTPESHRAAALELRRLGKLEQAIAELNAALQINPTYAAAYYNIAVIRVDQGRLEDAITTWRKAIEVKPDYSQAYSSLCVALRRLGRLDEAIAAGRESVRLKPSDSDAHANLATALHATWKFDEAFAHFECAIKLDSKNVRALNNYGNALLDKENPARAAALYRRAIEIDPGNAEIHNNLGNALSSQARVDEAVECYRRTLALKPDAWHVHSNLLLCLNCLPRSGDGLLAEHLDWANRHTARLGTGLPRSHKTGNRLRVGYVSPDFRRHSVAFFFEPILQHHDRDQFEIFCYSNVQRPDHITQRLEALASQWRPITGLPDEHVAQLIREDGIDILVDLSGHTAHHRLLVFARKPAPVQVTYLGYPNTTGLAAMDYRITDEQSDPTGTTEANYTERLLRLPHGFLCYRPPENSPEAREVEDRAGVTFGTFNNFAKVTPQIIALWSQILLASSGSRLLIKAECLGDDETRNTVLRWFAAHGVEPSRLELVGREPNFAAHLAMYHRLDVALDTFPYHGTTTTCEAMWMGVPVVTLAGKCHAARVGVSLMTHVGLPELVAGTPQQYVRIATELAGDVDRRRSLRGGMRDRMRSSPLMDAPGFTRNLETSYHQMAEARGRRPKGASVSDG
ncbi:MAG TPA: tetratricopeptide repeat protein [Tepidisphaeraceae bacterium]